MSQQWQPPQYDPRAQQYPPQPPPWEQPGYGQPLYQPPAAAYARVQPPSPPQSAPPAQKPGSKSRPLRGCLTLVAVAGVVVVIIVVATGAGGSGASWKATVGGTAVINPADLAVTVHVTNTGKTAGTPTCKVQANDPSYAYTGFDEGTLTNPVQPGQTVTYVDNVTITGQGAQYVTQATVSC